MKKKILIAGAMLLCLPFLGSAQEKIKHKKYGGVKIKHPDWAAPQHYTDKEDVYFPDYRVFYDPATGYNYYENGKWISTETVPEYLNGVDLGKARMEVVKEGITPDVQKTYIRYNKMYPAKKVDVMVPTPPGE